MSAGPHNPEAQSLTQALRPGRPRSGARTAPMLGAARSRGSEGSQNPARLSTPHVLRPGRPRVGTRFGARVEVVTLGELLAIEFLNGRVPSRQSRCGSNERRTLFLHPRTQGQDQARVLIPQPGAAARPGLGINH